MAAASATRTRSTRSPAEMAERGVVARAGEATLEAVRWTGRLLRGQVVQGSAARRERA